MHLVNRIGALYFYSGRLYFRHRFKEEDEIVRWPGLGLRCIQAGLFQEQPQPLV